MAKKHVFAKDAAGFGDFIYVDLLPEVKRSRQFNMNVIIALLFAITIGFFLIYRPYRDATFQIEELTSLNNDLNHELVLTNEEFNGYEIDLDAIHFQDDIDRISKLRINFNNLIDDVALAVDDNNGHIRTIEYDGVADVIIVRIAIVSQFNYNTLNNQLLNLPWVENCSYSTPTRPGDSVEYISTFTIEVNYNAE